MGVRTDPQDELWQGTLTWELVVWSPSREASHSWSFDSFFLPFLRESIPSGLSGRRKSGNARDSPRLLFFQYEDHHADWLTNEAGFSHSHQHGFGLLNAWRLVNAAKVNQVLASRIPCIEKLREGTNA
jgi:hypothetical protein